MKRCDYKIVLLSMLISLFVACGPKENIDKFALSCGAALTVTEGESEIISVQGGGNFLVATDNAFAGCVKNNATITVTGVKVGQCRLTVTAEDGEKIVCTITIERSAAQKDFKIFSTPRVENWLDEVVETEKTAGLQVTCEKNIDAAGLAATGCTTYGFYFVEGGAYCRLSAKGNFNSTGLLSDGMVAIAREGEPAQYYLCEKVEVVNHLNGKSWIVASMPSRADLRIVVEVFP